MPFFRTGHRFTVMPTLLGVSFNGAENGDFAEGYNSNSDPIVDNSDLVPNDIAPMHRSPSTVASGTTSVVLGSIPVL